MTATSREALRCLALCSAFVAATTATATTVAAQSTGRALGVDTTAFDRSVRPQDDFFRFVNGGWIARTDIPRDAGSWGSFNELRENSRTALHAIVDSALKTSAPAGSELRKVRDLYSSYMDSARVETLGLTPLRGELRLIAGVTSAKQLPATFARLAKIGVQGPVSVNVGPDQKNSTMNILGVSQSGLGLPDRDYYLKTDAKMIETRQAYQDYISKLLTLARQPDPSGAAARIVALETRIAEKHWDRPHNRDRNATYNKMNVAHLFAMAPDYSFPSYLAATGLAKASDVIVRQPSYIPAIDTIVAATPVATWREYMTFKLLDEYADELPAAFQNARFDFRGRTLSGQEEMAVRWKRGVDEVGGTLGEAVGKLYVQRNFKPEAKARMDALVQNLREAYQIGIDSLSWMSPATKAQAKDKLAHFTVKIAYPDKWRDYSSLTIKAGDLLGNARRANEFQFADMVSHLGKPVDRARWGMTPQMSTRTTTRPTTKLYFPPRSCSRRSSMWMRTMRSTTERSAR